MDTPKIVGTSFFWYSYSKKIDTQNLGHYNLWVLKTCGYSKFVGIRNLWVFKIVIIQISR